MIIGDGVGLRQLEEEDLGALRDWRNRAHYRKYFREYREINMVDQRKWFLAFVTNDHRTLMFGVVDLATSELIGVCGLSYINWVHRHADLSLYIGKDDLYIDTGDRGYAWRTLDALLRYGFDEINLHKVWSEIYAFDEQKHRLFTAYGLGQDGVLRENYFYDGRYQDSHIYSILDRDWRSAHAR